MKKKNFKENILINTIKASAGFPSPAENYIEERLDLNKHLIKKSEYTFFIRVSGDSMIDIGINNNDILVVDKGIFPSNKSIVIASLDGELLGLYVSVESINKAFLTKHFGNNDGVFFKCEPQFLFGEPYYAYPDLVWYGNDTTEYAYQKGYELKSNYG